MTIVTHFLATTLGDVAPGVPGVGVPVSNGPVMFVMR